MGDKELFTGIVREAGKVASIEKGPDGAVLRLGSQAVWESLEIGASVSVNGVCLTAERIAQESFQVTATPETLRRSNLGELEAGDPVNLEPAMRLEDFVGGHLVQGHVDATGRVLLIRPEGNSHIFRFQAPEDILRYCVMKGSITVDGVSLTISALGSSWFEVAIIPHTLEVTNFSALREGDLINLEADVISKYVESHVQRFLEGSQKR